MDSNQSNDVSLENQSQLVDAMTHLLSWAAQSSGNDPAVGLLNVITNPEPDDLEETLNAADHDQATASTIDMRGIDMQIYGDVDVPEAAAFEQTAEEERAREESVEIRQDFADQEVGLGDFNEQDSVQVEDFKIPSSVSAEIELDPTGKGVITFSVT